MTSDDGGSSAPAPAPSPELDAGPVREKTEWVLRFLNERIGDDEVGDVFSPAFLAQVPPEQVTAVADQLRPDAPYVIESIERESANQAVLVLRGSTGVALTMSIGVDGGDEARIVLLAFQ